MHNGNLPHEAISPLQMQGFAKTGRLLGHATLDRRICIAQCKLRSERGFILS